MSGIIIDGASSHEPSFINIELPVKRVDDLNSVEKLNYYPNYWNITPEQRYKYLRFLENPFDLECEIGYVFMFYYGLERFFLTDRYRGAIDLALRLLDNHKNPSLYSYISSAILLKCVETGDKDELLRLLEKIDVIDNMFPPLRIFLYFQADKVLNAKDIILLTKDYIWKNKRYIQKYSEIFEKNITKRITDDLKISNIINNVYLKNLNKFNVCRYANVSIDYRLRDGKLPNLYNGKKVCDFLYEIMEKAHNDTKQEINKKRKQGEIQPEIITGKFKEI